MGDRPSDWSSRRRKVLRRDNHTCQNCGRKGGPNGDAELHVHHSVPVSKGGSNQLSNLITHCKQCHDAIHGGKMAPTAKSSVKSKAQGLPSTLTGGSGVVLTIMLVLLVFGTAAAFAIDVFVGVGVFIFGSYLYVKQKSKIKENES